MKLELAEIVCFHFFLFQEINLLIIGRLLKTLDLECEVQLPYIRSLQIDFLPENIDKNGLFYYFSRCNRGVLDHHSVFKLELFKFITSKTLRDNDKHN